MPYVNIKLTRENGSPTKEQKQRIIQGVTKLLVKFWAEILPRLLW